MCWSCSDDNDLGDGNGSDDRDAVLNKGTQTEQVIYADEEGVKDEGIKFSTQGAWTAEVVEVSTRSTDATPRTVDWLTLSQYSGDKAGDYTINLTLKQNFTGKSRKAEIRILCGQTVITITVEQKAEKEDGIKLKRVKSVDYAIVLGAEEEKRYYEDADCSFTYSYDEQGRVAKVVQSWEDEESTYRFDYHVLGEIMVNVHNRDFNPPYDHKEEYHLILNKQGNVEKYDNESNGYHKGVATYTQDGRLETFETKNVSSFDCSYIKYFYTNGLLTKTEEQDYYDMYTTEFDLAKTYPNHYPANGANIDFNAFILADGSNSVEMSSLLSQIGLLGKGSDCLMEIIYPDDNYAVLAEDRFTEPGKVHKKTERVIEYSKEEMIFPVKYEFDGDKYVTRFSYTEPYEVFEHYYEIHVDHELRDPYRPEQGYKYEIKNEKWTKLSDERNTFTWTVTYE